MEVVHVDFHCDMRGLLVDRDQQLGWQIPEIRSTLDEGNYLRYAIFENIVNGVTWVHGSPGGRLYDVHTVKYTSDWSSRFHRKAVSKVAGKKIHFDVQEMNSWQGIQDRVFLDIDWDTFADQSLNESDIDRRVNEFLDKPMTTDLVGIAVCYSTHHSLDSRPAYERFVDKLAERFQATIERGEYEVGSNELPLRMKLIPPAIYTGLQRPYHQMRLGLKRIGLQ